MATVLVTGASGFLGATVMPRLLQAGHQAIGLDPAPSANAAWRHVIDDLSSRWRLTELLRAEKITHVIHCGGVSGPMVLADDPAQVFAINHQIRSRKNTHKNRDTVNVLKMILHPKCFPRQFKSELV